MPAENWQGVREATQYSAKCAQNQDLGVFGKAGGSEDCLFINVLAPYMLTALTQRPDRLIYITSGMQQGVSGKQALADLLWEKRRYNGSQAYSESKLLDSMLAFAVARKWQNVLSNTVDPGWVRTRMGGAYAPGSIEDGAATQIWLAGSDDKAVLVNGKSFNRMRESSTNPDAYNVDFQEELLVRCEQFSGVKFLQK